MAAQVVPLEAEEGARGGGEAEIERDLDGGDGARPAAEQPDERQHDAEDDAEGERSVGDTEPEQRREIGERQLMAGAREEGGDRHQPAAADEDVDLSAERKPGVEEDDGEQAVEQARDDRAAVI